MEQEEVDGLKAVGEARGLVTRTEALKFLTARQLQRRLDTGAWVRVHPTVFRVVGALVDWRQQVCALKSWAGKGSVLSHRTAAALHQLEGFPEGPLELTTTRAFKVTAGVRIYRVKAVPHNDITEIDGLDVTSVTRTLVDLAVLTDRYTMRAAIDHALREKQTTLEKLQKAAARSKKRVGVIDLRNLLEEFEGDGGPTESELERHSLELIEVAGLPSPTVQWTVIAGRKRRRLDLLFKEQGVAVESDGYAFHSGIDSFEDDRRRNNSLTAIGFRVLHWTWTAVHDRPEELITELYAALNCRR